MDIVSKKVRSRMMASVGSANTKPEKIVRSILHGLGYRFRLHRKDLPGSPDIVLPKYKKVIFVHGCFWHQHDGCPKSKRPTSRTEFWNKKLDGNIHRDKKNISQLQALGWTVDIIWECQTFDVKELRNCLENFFRDNG
jgi:DNA mismatch endonuclease (patch repair protein)